ncbi:hypothetical protein [Streptomyces sp. NPDC048606]|uniref:hypothetical protein n=1 Tax=Streptomyces sp. NPDC048606 TaxID=3154726 RepID=UPI00343866D1
MSEQQPNPYSDHSGDYKWGPGNPGYGYPQPYGDLPANQQPTLGAGMPAPGFGAGPVAGGYGAAGFGAGGFALGDITVAGDQIITPSGTMPLKGAMWNAVDFSRTEEKIPTHAIVLAIVFALACLLGLLFLLMKEKVTTGFIQVTVSSGGRHHATMIPAADAYTMQWVMGQLSYARSLSV